MLSDSLGRIWSVFTGYLEQVNPMVWFLGVLFVLRLAIPRGRPKTRRNADHAEGNSRAAELSAHNQSKERENKAALWRIVSETLAWAVVAAFLILLMQARQLDRWHWNGKFAALVVVPLFGGAAMTYLRGILHRQPKPLSVVEAESFVLKYDGKVLGRFGAEGGFPQLVLLDQNGVVRVLIAVSKDSVAEVSLRGARGNKPIVSLMAYDQGSSVFVSSDGLLRLLFSAGSGRESNLTIFDENEKPTWSAL